MAESVSIIAPLIDLLAEKLDFIPREITNFTIIPTEDHEMVFAWLEYDEKGPHIEVGFLSFEEFNAVSQEAIDALTDSGVISPQMYTNAMQQVELMDALGIEMSEYQQVADYVREVYPGALEFPPDDLEGFLRQARDAVREQ